jgi:transposase InsO family protein
MSTSDSDSDAVSASGPRIKPFKSSTDYPLWSKLILNYLSGNSLLPAVLDDIEPKSGAPAVTSDVDNVDAALSSVNQEKTISASKKSRMNAKAYSFIFARLHHSVIADLSSESSDPTKPNAKVLWEELRKRYGGGEMQQLVSTIDVILQTRIHEHEDPKDKLNVMRTAFDKLNSNKIPFDDKLFTLILLRCLPESYSATVQVLFAKTKMMNVSSTEVITSARSYYELKHTTDDESTVALAARKDGKWQKDSQRNQTGGTLRCIYHPNSNTHTTEQCRTGPANAQRPNPSGKAQLALASDSDGHTHYQATATAFVAQINGFGNRVFYLDSGASDHMTCNINMMTNVRKHNSTVTIGDGKPLRGTHRGTIQISDALVLENVLYVPDLRFNLVSVRQLCKDRTIRVTFDSWAAYIRSKPTQVVIAKAPFDASLGVFTLSASPSLSIAMTAQAVNPILLWHNRLGHLGFSEVVRLAKEGLLDRDATSACSAMTPDDIKNLFCEPCTMGKGTRQPSPVAPERATKPNERVHIDIWGPARTPTAGKARYLLTCQDDYTRRTQIFFLKRKSDALDAFRDYIALVENHCESKVKTVRRDNGGEFTSHEFSRLLANNGIEAIPIPPDAHSQNGRVERQHLTIFNLVRTYLIDTGLPDTFWGEAAAYAVHVRNHLPRPGSIDSPISIWTGRPSKQLSHLRPFGSVIYVRDHTQSNKLRPRYFKAILMGWQPLSDSSVRYYCPSTRKLGYSRDVTYGPPASAAPEIPQPQWRVIPSTISPPSIPSAIPPIEKATTTSAHHQDPEGDDSQQSFDGIGGMVEADGDGEHIPEVEEDMSEHEVAAPIDQPNDSGDSPIDTNAPETSSQSKRTRHYRPGKGYEYQKVFVPDVSPEPEHPPASYTNSAGRRVMTRTTQNRPSATITEIRSEDTATPVASNAAVAMALIGQVVNSNPSSYHQARQSDEWPQWKLAHTDELAKMDRYRVWSVVRRKGHMRVLQGRWVYTRKIDGTTGLPSSYKARWVAKGYNQIEGLDYTDIFASVAHKDTVRVFLALVNHMDLECDQVDIVAAFLNGILKETIYMEPPPGSDIPSGHVLLLHKSLYGLKQSPRCFNDSLDTWLKSEGFQSSRADPCLYTFSHKGIFIMLTVHVDDQLIASNNRPALDAFKKRLNDKFECKDQGPVNYFLGFNVIRDRNSRVLSISHEHYLESLLRRFNMHDCHPTKTVLPTTFKPEPATDAEHEEAKHMEYPQIVGSIMYAATISRPDLAYPANLLARFISKWSMAHYKAAKHLLRYIRGTTDLCLTYDTDAGKRIALGYADADWGGCLNTRRSTTGYVFKTFGGIVAWRSRRQPTVALSTAEAEIMATVDAGKQAIWLKRLLEDLGYPVSEPLCVLNDNMGAVSLSHHPGNHDRTKHIDMRHHWLQEKVEDKTLKVEHVSTENNLADIFTKPLPLVKAQHFSQVLGLRRVPIACTK